MQKIGLIAIMVAAFAISYFVFKNYAGVINMDKIGQVVGLGAVAAGYFGAKAWKKINVEEKWGA